MRHSFIGVLVLVLTSCQSTPRRPSILLVVLDTTRADAVSAYGHVAGTTPTFDRLAANGLRYSAAYAQSNWTLPSHATIFTGVLPTQHGMYGYRDALPEAQVTLAALLASAGYETIGLSENPWLNRANGMTRGFDRFGLVNLLGADANALGKAIDEWARYRRSDRPFFLFVNIMDAHAPYEVRAQNPFLPAGVDTAGARRVSQDLRRYLCRADASSPDVAVLRGLYLGDVAAADAKLADVLARLHSAGLDDGLVTIVTADHGEHFGEHRLVLHDVGVHEALIHVPLAVHGLPKVTPAVISDTVELADLMPTILGWAGVGCPAGLAGRPLPTMSDRTGTRRAVIAEYSEVLRHVPAEVPPALVPLVGPPLREACGPGDRVFGDMRALIDQPMKLIWYEDYQPELYNIADDPAETVDLAADRPDTVASLAAELTATVAHLPGAAPGVAQWGADTELRDRLRALGYVTGD